MIIENMKIVRLAILIALTFLTVQVVVARTSDVIQTIPPVSTSSVNAIAGCTFMDVNPGSVIASTSGYVETRCLSGYSIFLGAIILGTATPMSTTVTPTFLLATGWIAIGLAIPNFCSPLARSINPLTHQLMKANITSSVTMTFTNVVSNSTLRAGGYDYCLYYSNPPLNGFASFTISWT